MTVISRKALADLVEARLTEILGPNVAVYRGGDVPEPPPLIETAGGPDESGRIAKYVALHAGGGIPVIDLDLAQANTELDWSFSTMAAAGYPASCEALVDAVHFALFRWTPAHEGIVFGRVVPPPGYDPGPVRKQTFAGMPPRFYLPQQWRLAAAV